MNKGGKRITVQKWILYFFLYSVLGWLYEVFLEVVVYQWGFSNRGVLLGPYCVIYGFGALLLVFLLTDLKRKELKVFRLNLAPLAVFAAIVLITAAVELIGSYIMEFTTGSWLWNYRDYFCNFQGRIALNPSLRFGFGGMIFLYILQPLFEQWAEKLSPKALAVISGLISLILAVDFCHLILG